MELAIQSLSFASINTDIMSLCFQGNRDSKAKELECRCFSDSKRCHRRRKLTRAALASPETVASMAIVATVVGAAATILVKRTKAPDPTEVPLKTCEDCEGSGICSECKGEGFVLKKMADGSSEKARMTANNMATRYTAGLPKKWSYCTKCSAARSCKTCGGRGKLSY